MSSTGNEKNIQLPPKITEQLKKGNKIEAIKLLREEKGPGLKEAKELIDQIANEGTFTGNNNQNQENFSLLYTVLNHLRAGKKIDAIKALRNETGVGLKDAKDIVEKALLEYPDVKLRYDAENKRGVVCFLLFTLAVILIVIIIYNILN